jgi:hypothetical protein
MENGEREFKLKFYRYWQTYFDRKLSNFILWTEQKLKEMILVRIEWSLLTSWEWVVPLQSLQIQNKFGVACWINPLAFCVYNTGEETENGRTETMDNMEYKYEKWNNCNSSCGLQLRILW